MNYPIQRRDFLRQSSVAAAAAALWPQSLYAQPDKKVRLGFIGVGLRGRNHVHNALGFADVEIPAICDVDPEAIAATQKLIRESGRKEAAAYAKGDHDFERMLKRDDLDGVIIATPWEWHVPMAVATMKAGKYAGVEVSATVTLQESWDLVDTYEKTGAHCMILENVCYRRDVMAVLNMVRQGLFGELIHLQCGYQHDLRPVKFNNGKQPYGGGVEFGEKAFSEARWRTQHSVDRNGDLYPTHGLGPVAQMIDINRGNQFLYLTSMATKSRGLHKYIVDNGGPNHPNAKVQFKLGDVVQTMIKCANGETILITHDTNSPRPYSLGFRVQGTQGLWLDDGDQIYIEGTTQTNDEWESDAAYMKTYDHPYWQASASVAEGAGHGGMDYFVIRDFINAVKTQTAPPIDVYDAAAWSAISPLSEQSIAQGSAPIEIPDFTRGKWKSNRPIFGL
ncbi:Tat (twin-arginine translocation) pathway signal sequence [Catalinimonas alkaloidigena]|uniref:Tat (Twin-arginine translocation) pathway signal sequence n=1 Tax=Catalinimonas alkaloidigena TaxID=1075417 RepID=A0A1G9J1H6_9BACT|nr:Gfo/Idh/MocA family oxidoreductase [Catalinimonas alkaloidigena]SDL30984.1 Tat (twin-arginine translocation) pathway signal sequence [Catalinimonas alkaloidigena]